MSRHAARETAFQMTFQIDVGKNSQELAERTMEEALAEGKIRSQDVEYIKRVVNGIIQERPLLDDFIRRHTKNWSPERINPIEKNIIRLALYEGWFCEDVPLHVALNEAVELAKTYGDDDAYAFVNGILDNISKEELPQKNGKTAYLKRGGNHDPRL